MNILRFAIAGLKQLLLTSLLTSSLAHGQVDTGTTFNGSATYFTPAEPGAFQISNGEFNNLFVAMDLSRKNSSAWCGAWLVVTWPGGTTQVPGHR